ncbi:DUF4190 domain-containing protein [Demequina sp. SYSU T00192]|uniref:DUF4190 domain-containing protein n=1 Tax=Demequina litoralis TaxID=3051660 RepID=A0ABT8G7Q4_9MICO|nr:DUF4190 domain-containing protein [Demequina sp. SYSU T00192]MDN4475181.1 DUF4190 domain-containing protein [Demequina sp. SYSU T00192]
MVDTIEVEAPQEVAVEGGNGVGIASFVTGCLGLGPIAIVLGLVGLSRWRSGAAGRRSWPLAGLVLGIVGTLGAAALAAAVLTSGTDAAEQDLRAQADVVMLGNAVVEGYVADPDGAVTVSVEPSGYVVDGIELPAQLSLDEDRAVSLEGTDAFDWCLTLTYGGGQDDAVAFAATEGLVRSCPVP